MLHPDERRREAAPGERRDDRPPVAMSRPDVGADRPYQPCLGEQVEPLLGEHRQRVDLVGRREQDLVREPPRRIHAQLRWQVELHWEA